MMDIGETGWMATYQLLKRDPRPKRYENTISKFSLFFQGFAFVCLQNVRTFGVICFEE
jgi:hypothetical protein